MKGAFERYLFGPIAAERPYLLMRLTLLLMAFDMWLCRLEHGGRYGAGGFNVSHFALLDAIQPEVTTGLYVGLVILVGLICFVLGAAPKMPRWAMATGAVLYTWSWAMSMLDSYQHHYLLSLVFLWLIFFPRTTAAELERGAEPAAGAGPPKKRKKKRSSKKSASKKDPKDRGPTATGGRWLAAIGAVMVWIALFSAAQNLFEEPIRGLELLDELGAFGAWGTRLLVLLLGVLLFVSNTGEGKRWRAEPRSVSAWAYVALAHSCAVVYLYTAWSKTDEEWRMGHAMRSITHNGQTIEPLRDLFAAVGVTGDSFWLFMGHSVILVQLIIAAGYLLSPLRDRVRHRAYRIFMWVAFFTALSFHLGAEYMDLKIGWFSWYMVIFAGLYMLPRGAVVWAAALLTVPARELVRWWSREVEGQDPMSPLAVGVAGTAIGLILGGMGYALNLPGALVVGVLSGVALVAAVIFLLARGEGWRARGLVLVGALAGLSLFASLINSDVRFDYYRNVGGDYRRRHDYGPALEAYIKANLYAPPGQDRREQEAEMRRVLGQQGSQ